MNYAVRTDFPHHVREIENVFIPMRDGCRLAARMWLPETAEARPVPAIFEYIPYRKRDFMRARDEPMHHYLAGHGYAALRVDLRGSGDSEGVLQDEYLPQEQHDALDVIEWLTQQPWCNGAIGMTGISWGGFNSLQVAAHRPRALKAIITLCASDDRYADDAHYMGGCLLNENQIWGTVLFALNALPPDPLIVGERWREMWFERLQQNYPYPARWLMHQKRDEYWRQGSICENFADITCAVYAIGGWADGYSNAIPRLLSGLTAPKKGLVGPWAHAFPHDGVPGPSIGYLQEAIRWWDYWLKNIDNGIMQEPAYRAWMQKDVKPAPLHEYRAGRWIAENAWPPEQHETLTLYFSPSLVLSTTPQDSLELEIQSPQTTGSTGGDWCGFGAEGEAPMDQRADDGRSLSFDSAPLPDSIEIFGATEIRLRVKSDQKVALLAIRLNEVANDGTSTLITYGVLNLTHRDSHEHPSALEPKVFYDVDIKLNDIAHRFAQGSVIRLAISTCYWPLVWPSPKPATITLETAASVLRLPVRVENFNDESLLAFAEAEAAPSATQNTALRPPRFIRTYERDLTTHKTTYRLFSEGGDLESGAVMRVDQIGMDLGHTVERRFTIGEVDPNTACAEISEKLMMRRPGWEIKVQVDTQLTADEKYFYLNASLAADENGIRCFEKQWCEKLARELL